MTLPRPIITHVADLRSRPRALPNALRARLPTRRVVPTKLALGHVPSKAGTALVLIDDVNGREECEIHESVTLAIGQAEFEFGVTPSEWREANAESPAPQRRARAVRERLPRARF